jgi:hypothetical protein
MGGAWSMTSRQRHMHYGSDFTTTQRVARGVIRLLAPLLGIPALVGATVLIYHLTPPLIGTLVVVSAIAMILIAVTRMVMG